MFTNNLVLILVVREVKPIEKIPLPSQIEQLLKEFVDVFPEKLLVKLPSIKGIGHQINLILGANLPNRSAYRCNLVKDKEL